MNIKFLFCFLVYTQISFLNGYSQSKYIKPPVPLKIYNDFMSQGDPRIDEYFWLRDKDNPKVIEHLNAENKYSQEILKPFEKLQKKIFSEIIKRINPSDKSAPYLYDGYFYYIKYIPGKEYPVYCRKKDKLTSREEIMLDINEIAKPYKLFKISETFISTDNNILAFGVDTMGNRKYVLTFLDLKKEVFLDDVLNNTSGNMVWTNDNKTVFYCVNDETLRSYKVFKHILGAPAEKDVEIYHEKDNIFRITLHKSKTKEYIFISSNSVNSSEVRYLDANLPNENFKIIQPREPNLLYSVEQIENKFIIKTNNNAKNFKIVETFIKEPQKNNWKDLVAHNENIFIQNFTCFKDFLVLEEKKDGLPKIHIINFRDKSEHDIKFEEESYSAFLAENFQINTDLLRLGYTSLTTPVTIFDYNMNTKSKIIIKESQIPGGYNKNNYETKRIFAIASDGTKIPISIVYKKGMDRNGNNPLLLYGYGSYGNSIPPAFSSDRLSLLDRGFIYGIAHIRGGQEMGRYWYEDGKLLKKKNTFTDFISCSEYLINEKYTNPDKLFANGISAGGLLMGAILNMRPELYKGVIAEVPWVDIVTDMFDESLPLTTLEYDEWGNPKNKEFYDYMLSYSPYDNVKSQKYPAILATGGLNDTQVPFWSPAKWVAKLREMKQDNNIILLKINMNAGHSGDSGRFESNKLIALKYVFMLNLLGINK